MGILDDRVLEEGRAIKNDGLLPECVGRVSYFHPARKLRCDDARQFTRAMLRKPVPETLTFNETLTILGRSHSTTSTNYPRCLYRADTVLRIFLTPRYPPFDTLTTRDRCFLHFSLP